MTNESAPVAIAAPIDIADLRSRLPELTLRDEHRLRRQLDRAGNLRDPEAAKAALATAAEAIEQAAGKLAARRESIPAVSYPPALPVSQKKDEIAAAIRDNQVVIVAGETGSGKTTQLPKICLELGRGVRGLIGHTQPRRLAARTVAERIAEELGTELGDAVGYTVRFTDQVSDATVVKLMTDGILLAEIQRDRDLRRYDTIIIDEAHERSLNIDFLLGYLKQLLPRRPDLKLIITSATIDPERFAKHFGDAPIVEVSGRTYPVEVRYRPVIDPDDENADKDRDVTSAIIDAVHELSGEGPGDILVFLSGEREIRDTADALTKENLRNTEIAPLYARLAAAEQHKVFQPHGGRRIVLATNVAETSLTVPGIKYVIDPGTARISRYSLRTKVQRLPIEPVSQASANQRKGRCGRLSDGICIRLYTEADFESRPEYTDPEILRTNLASVILQMAALGLGDIAAFPFVEPPDKRNITDGLQLLSELGALQTKSKSDGVQLTAVGKQLAQIPIDPRLARMVLEADKNGVVPEVLVIAAALSIQDPRERPTEHQQAADEKHKRFADQHSDFSSYLLLWNYLRDQQRELSGSGFRRLCKAEFLHYLRVREWQDLHGQLRQIVRGLGITVDRNADPGTDGRNVHVALLAGLLSHIGMRDEKAAAKDQPTRGRRPLTEYFGARGARFAIFPGSTLAKRPPRWVVAAELVETSRLWGRITARIEPEWVEPLAGHLAIRTYSEPHWDAERGAVMATEKVTLYGIPLIAGRPVTYGKVDPELSRDLFIQHALVEGEWRTHHKFFARNRELLKSAAELEHRARRRDLVVDDQTLFDFYDERVGAEVVSARHFDSWWKKVSRETPDLLDFSASMLVNQAAGDLDIKTAYPDHWDADGVRLRLTYQFEPGTAADGVTVHIPVAILNQVTPDQFGWQVPGLRQDLVTAMIRSLPKELRRNFVPAPDVARAALAGISPADGPLPVALAAELRRLTGISLPVDAWQDDRIPDHLAMTFRVEDDRGRRVGEGKDLVVLQRQLAPLIRDAIATALTAPDEPRRSRRGRGGRGRGAGAAAPTAAGPDVTGADGARSSASISKEGSETEGLSLEQTGLKAWSFETLPQVVERRRGGFLVKAYPALVDEGESVAVRLLGSPAEQRAAMLTGTRRLVLLTVPSPNKAVVSSLSNSAKLALGRNPHGSVAALLADCIAAAADELIAAAGGPVWDAAGFAKLRDAVRGSLVETTLDVLKTVEKVLAATHAVGTLLPTVPAGARADVQAQLDALVYPGFVAATGRRRMTNVLRYVQAIQRRLENVRRDPARDQGWQDRIAAVTEVYRDWLNRLPLERRSDDAVREIRWMIEELRVSLFAQSLGTAYAISEQRIYRAMDAAGGGVTA
ncbi:ATP-dependent RNA helicase HrpA [Cryptosporangium aurantiacum]|uniref:RNA helicase n=1 Tax=Cryptosporangium aurantiacum TaxID=134849 RepID=A0A1M7NQB8_9ACTN|nr:ATP-dependent RNA helicase HrpA [Cryptosporangium aurantiacum]SHN05973.1 ATP-dependent helicase HrpA [Cryptosporangium aurantiacum]